MTLYLPHIIAFFSGAVFLGLEILSSRILAPMFGNSIYVWGSLIAVFLLALSIGYRYGGIVADQYPNFLVLAIILIGAGLLVLIIPVLQEPVQHIVDDLEWELRISVLLATMLLFFSPSLLMGMVSPFLVRLNVSTLNSVGRAAGDLYAISTVGSIVGVLGVSFFLIPLFGSKAIIFGCGITLLLTAIIALVAHRLNFKQAVQ
jgi:hypothetical protein